MPVIARSLDEALASIAEDAQRFIRTNQAVKDETASLRPYPERV
jgi:hypothetical protein